MPPKAKFSKEEVINAALNLVRSDGIEALTARALGEKLGSSPRPIFTVFQSMAEVAQEVTAAAQCEYNKYIQEGLSQETAFKGVGAQYILFAVKEPKLFQLLFMREVQGQEQVPDFEQILPLIDHNYDKILESIQKQYGLSYETSRRLYQHLWVYTHGIAVLCATKMCQFRGEEVNSLMTEVFKGLLGNLEQTT